MGEFFALDPEVGTDHLYGVSQSVVEPPGSSVYGPDDGHLRSPKGDTAEPGAVGEDTRPATIDVESTWVCPPGRARTLSLVIEVLKALVDRVFRRMHVDFPARLVSF